jgi:hypothetical protein
MLLRGLLKPGGSEHRLYSELGRKTVVEAHKAIRRDYPPTPEACAFRTGGPQILSRETLSKL